MSEDPVTARRYCEECAEWTEQQQTNSGRFECYPCLARQVETIAEAGEQAVIDQHFGHVGVSA
ncbi:hypothetical protein ACKVMT_06975 [Halobacteriales archaeon Cl-PHB]